MGPVVGGMGGAHPPPNLGTDRDMYWNNPPQQGNNPNSTFNWGEKDMIWNTSDYNKVITERKNITWMCTCFRQQHLGISMRGVKLQHCMSVT